VRDVVLIADEIRGLTAGLLASHQPALGRVSFLEWLKENASTLDRADANEWTDTSGCADDLVMPEEPFLGGDERTPRRARLG
jgi:hypothetical protein